MVAYLQSLRFDQFTSDGTSPNDALNKLASAIKGHFPNAPRDWRTEYNKIQVLYDAVAGQDWSRTAIESVHIDIKTFEAFCARLANSLQKQLRLETITGTSSRHGSFIDQSSQGIYFNQGRYVNPKAPANRPRPRTATRDRLFSTRFSGKCFNCGTPGHRANQCRKQIDWRRSKANEAVWVNHQQGKPADDAYGVKLVFCELADALNEVLSVTTEDAYLEQAEDEAQALFSSITLSDVPDAPMHEVRFNETANTQSEGEQATADINLFLVACEACNVPDIWKYCDRCTGIPD